MDQVLIQPLADAQKQSIIPTRRQPDPDKRPQRSAPPLQQLVTVALDRRSPLERLFTSSIRFFQSAMSFLKSLCCFTCGKTKHEEKAEKEAPLLTTKESVPTPLAANGTATEQALYHPPAPAVMPEPASTELVAPPDESATAAAAASAAAAAASEQLAEAVSKAQESRQHSPAGSPQSTPDKQRDEEAVAAQPVDAAAKEQEPPVEPLITTEDETPAAPEGGAPAPQDESEPSPEVVADLAPALEEALAPAAPAEANASSATEAEQDEAAAAPAEQAEAAAPAAPPKPAAATSAKQGGGGAKKGGRGGKKKGKGKH